MYRKIENRNTIDKSIKRITKFVKESGQKSVFDFDGHPIVTDNHVHILYDFFINSKGTDKMISGMILDSFQEMEKNGPGSSIIALNILREIFDNSVKVDYPNLKKDLPTSLFKVESEVFDNIMSQFIRNEKLRSIVKESVNFSGPMGKIFIDDHNYKDFVIDLNKGFSFDVIFPIGPFSGEESESRSDCKFICIDGVIEKISEIHYILEQLSKTKDPVIFVTRGYSHEVLSTFSVNNQRGTLNIIPVQIPFDPHKLNYLTDISIAAGSDIITPTMGQTFSSVKISEIPTVNYVKFFNGIMTIECSKNLRDVNNHINDLSRRRKKEGHEFSLIDHRIKNLTSNAVKIKISYSNSHEMRDIKNQIDLGLRLSSSLIKNGYISLSSLENSIKNKTQFESLFFDLMRDSYEFMPLSTMIHLLKNIKSLSQMINSTYVSLELER